DNCTYCAGTNASWDSTNKKCVCSSGSWSASSKKCVTTGSTQDTCYAPKVWSGGSCKTCYQVNNAKPNWNGSACAACPSGKPYWDGTQCVATCPASKPTYNANKVCVTCASLDSAKPAWSTTNKKCDTCYAVNNAKPYWNGSACAACPTANPIWNGTTCTTCPLGTKGTNCTQCIDSKAIYEAEQKKCYCPQSYVMTSTGTCKQLLFCTCNSNNYYASGHYWTYGHVVEITTLKYQGTTKSCSDSNCPAFPWVFGTKYCGAGSILNSSCEYAQIQAGGSVWFSSPTCCANSESDWTTHSNYRLESYEETGKLEYL
ncbi:MAG: hypothetical protein IJC11_07180, partial [Alphaproteobacteria bacterium]|nr:hypothetical protein [Alphaproteobacteria bacterium]